jgi:GntP family gluconate:H+ symporter
MIVGFGKLPNALFSFAPIVVPIILMALGSVARFPTLPFGAVESFAFLGTPVNALFVGFLFSLALLPKFDEETLSGWVGEGLRAAAIIIMVTGTGGALGRMLSVSGIGSYLAKPFPASTWVSSCPS